MIAYWTYSRIDVEVTTIGNRVAFNNINGLEMTNVKQLKHSQFIGNLYLFQHGIEFYREPRGLGVFILNMLQNSNNCFALVSTYTNTLFSKGHFYRLHLNLVLPILSSCMK